MSRYRIRDRTDGTYAEACVWSGPHGDRAGIRWTLKRPKPVTRAEARRMMGIARSYLGFMARSIVYVKVFGFVVRDANGINLPGRPMGRREARALAAEYGCKIVRVAL